MNWFAIVLRVVICFIILTDLTELSVEFCEDEVIKDRGGFNMRRRRRGNSSSGDAQGNPSKYSRRLKRLSLGMPRKASPLSSTSIGNFTWSYIFIHHMICVLLGASCILGVFSFCCVTIILAAHLFARNKHALIVILLECS